MIPRRFFWLFDLIVIAVAFLTTHRLVPYILPLFALGGSLRTPCLEELLFPNVEHCHFLPLQPRETLPTQLSAAVVLVITQRRTVTDVVFPGKLLYYMAAGRPILAALSAASETGWFITDHQVGVVTPPEDPEALSAVIRRLSQDDIRPMGLRGRAVAEAQFDRRVVLKHFTEQIESLPRSRGFGIDTKA